MRRNGNRARCALDHPLGGAAEQHPPDRAAPGRADHDQPGLDLVDGRCDTSCWTAPLHDENLGIDALRAQLGSHLLELLV
jgi:hypothetical protein